jgi:hypothetical protein
MLSCTGSVVHDVTSVPPVASNWIGPSGSGGRAGLERPRVAVDGSG